MGMESQPDITQEAPTGICNAIILAQPYAPFIVSVPSSLYLSYTITKANTFMYGMLPLVTVA